MDRPGSTAICVFSAALLIAVSGCRMGVPIHVWQPAGIESTVGKTVAIGTITGPAKVAAPLKQKLLAMAPTDSGRHTTAVDPERLAQQSAIQLVSGTDQAPSDLSIVSAARQIGVDYVLRGEVLAKRTQIPSATNADPGGETTLDPEQPLSLSWRLVSLADDRAAGGSPVVVDVPSAIKRYPDLAMLNDPAEILTTAATRDTYRLLTPSVQRDRVQLAIPYAVPGSQQVRRGNAAALAGRWGEAQRIWSEALEQHPTQVAALHNLAIAAAAGQDFSLAKQLARKAVRRMPTKLHQQTLVWIELKQRDYHDAFDLPDPPEGWYVTQGRSASVGSDRRVAGTPSRPAYGIVKPAQSLPLRMNSSADNR